MGLVAASVYWLIVAIWSCVLVCAIYYGITSRTALGAARVLMLVVGIDTVRDIAENVYFGLYFGSQYGVLSPVFSQVLGQPFLLLIPKLMNAGAGVLVLFILFLKWLPQAARERQALLAEASTDPLTGLLNRRQFNAAGRVEFERSRRTGRPLALLMLDIDHFKSVNDRFGHGTGDEVIRAMATMLRNESPGIDLCGRIGGEEFAILLPSNNADQARGVAEQLCSEAAKVAVASPSGTVQVTLSVGVAQFTPEMLAVEELLKWADRALYEAKRTGRDRVCTYVSPAIPA